MAKNQRPSLNYLLLSPYFIVNALTMLAYPLSRWYGMNQYAFAFAAESVSHSCVYLCRCSAKIERAPPCL